MNRQRGSTLVEFALAGTVLWLLLSGVYGIGRAFYAYTQLDTAVSSAAALGARMVYDLSDERPFAAALKNMVVYGDPDGRGAPLAPGLTTANVKVTVSTDPAGIPRALSVSIQHYSIDTIFHAYPLTERPRVTVPFLGRVACSGC